MRNKKKKVTLENLATNLEDLTTMVAKGFEHVENRMAIKEEVNARFDEVDKRFLGLEIKIDDLDRKVDRVDARVDEVYEILTRFEEGDILDLQKRIKILERTVKAIAQRVS